jgi:hypothetical protein
MKTPDVKVICPHIPDDPEWENVIGVIAILQVETIFTEPYLSN